MMARVLVGVPLWGAVEGGRDPQGVGLAGAMLQDSYWAELMQGQGQERTEAQRMAMATGRYC